MLFGDYRIENRLNLDLESAKISFERVNDHLVRALVLTTRTTVQKLIELERSTLITIKPVPPLAGPINVNCIFYVLEEPIVVLPMSKFGFEVRIPYDLGVFVEKEEVLRIPLGKVKYALYGTPDMGDVCRYFDPSVLRSYGEKLALTRLVIASSAKVSIELKKFVAPISSATVVYTESGRVFYGDISVHAVSPGHVEVVLHDEPPPVEEPYKVSIRGQVSTYIMRYGV